MSKKDELKNKEQETTVEKKDTSNKDNEEVESKDSKSTKAEDIKTTGEPDVKLVDKALLDNALSKIAELNKLYKAKLSEDEVKEIEETETLEELKRLRNEVKISNYSEKINKLGFDLEQSKTISRSILEDDIDSIVNILSEHLNSIKLGVEKDKLKNTPHPTSGTNNSNLTIEDFKKLSYKEQLELYKSNKQLWEKLTS